MQAPQPILTAASATGWGTAKRIGTYKHVIIGFITSGLGVGETATIKIAHSYSDDCPTFSSAASLTNQWAYVQTYNLAGGQPINGSTGISISGADGIIYLEMNQNVANWVNVQITTIDAGTVTVTCNLPERT